MQAFHDFAFPRISDFAGGMEDAFSDCVEYEELDRERAENHFATIRDAISEYGDYVASLSGKRQKLSKAHADRVHSHLRRIHNAVERVSARLQLSPDSKERLTTLLDGHKRAISEHLKKRLAS